jgi:hypothetical protein
MTYDELIKFGELMREHAKIHSNPHIIAEYETMAEICDELAASREHFGCVDKARFLVR